MDFKATKCENWGKSRAKCPFLPRVPSRVSGFPVTSPCLLGKLQNLSFSKVSKRVVMSFCEAGAALCDIPTCLITCRKSFCVAGPILLRRFHKISCSAASFSQDELQFSWQVQHFGDLCRHFARQAQRSTLHTLPSTLHTLHSTLHSTLYTPHFTLYTLHSTLYTPHSTLYPPHSTLHAPHSALYTPHSTLYTVLYSTLHTLHSTL